MTDIKYRIKENSFLALLAAYKLNGESVAFVLGRTIHLHSVSREEFLANESWVKHELCHLRQFREHGHIAFVFKYLADWVKNGYYNNKYEVEARAAENE